MDRRASHTTGPQTLNTTPPLDWPHQSSNSDPQSPQSRGALERISVNNLHSAFFRSTASEHTTIRAVTPDRDPISPSTAAFPLPYAPAQEPTSGPNNLTRTMSSTSPQTSPRSIARPGDFARRQGVVFNDSSFGASFDSTSSSPPPRQPSGTIRPRTHTMDGAFRQQFVSAAAAATAAASATSPEPRHRVGSFSSSSSQPLFDEARHPPPIPINSVGYSPVAHARSSDLPSASTVGTKEKKSSASTRRLVKRQVSRPTSPQPTIPAVDSLPIPIPTDDANKILLLMKTLCGRMRGEIEYLNDASGAWHSGVGYIDEERGALMVHTGHNSPFHTTLIPDLRGCRVSPVDLSDPEKRCLAIVPHAPSHTPVELLLYPLVAVERDLWLAVLLCWQQLRPPKVRLSNVNGSRSPTIGSMRPPPARRRVSGILPPRQTPTLIKLGQVRLWDKGLATSPRAIVKRPSTRDLRSPATSWRLVSCLLHDNGEIRLTTPDGDGVIAVVELSQLSRCAIQQLDMSVLDEEHCIAIFPRYSSVSTQLSIFRPVYIALENRVLLEVWYVLLRAFALPEIYHLGPSEEDQRVTEVVDLEADLPGEVFRVEKTISMRVTEAKLKPRNGLQEAARPNDRPARIENDPLVGNYLAEVILDGEVRARTPIRRATKNPYWREEYHFADIPSEMPFLSVLLKRVDGNPDALHPHAHLGSGSSRSSPTSVSEAPYGSVDITMDQAEQGKDFERWLEVYDERHQVVGTMLVKIHHHELVVLHSKEYKGLLNLLHNFPSGLTAQIADALSGQLRKLAEMLLNIFQVSGRANDWLQALVEDEIDGVGNQAQIKKYRFSRRLNSNESLESIGDQEQLRKAGKSLAGEANLLFRGNTLLTHALEFHMRRAGKEYLDHMLQAKMKEINELNPNCEVDPNRLRPGDDLGQNWNRLIQMVNEVWHCIRREPGRCPPELRAILKYVRSVAEDRYGDWLRTVTYTSVSSFLFLRFICPAILSPKLFGLLRDHPQPRAQRTFTLIAKALQALGNISTFGKKEEWMEPMNKFLAAQRQGVKDYMDTICAIPTERAQATLAPSYSTPMTVLGRLTPTAREGFPALPHLIDEARNCAALVKLWTDSNPLHGSASAQSSATDDGEDDILIFNEMCIDLQKRADACYAKMEGYRSFDVVSHQTVSDLAETLDKTTLDAINMSYGGIPPYPEHHSYNDGGMGRPPGSAGSDVAPAEPTQIPSQRNREYRRGREAVSTRHVSGYSDTSSSLQVSTSAGNTLKRNGGGGGGGRSTRTILSGIMKPFARGESPESASPRTRTGKSTERSWNPES
ncbi:hypothetical protein ACRALDRAFT_2097462 [Sodiomyces alcalophilus JCM 7366]|uniref:uncharacterized protein n=1 Tax=Sodiomyces alcalophilus JCM 7366 TaxID=591952 RepID=UPI0039B4DC1F